MYSEKRPAVPHPLFFANKKAKGKDTEHDRKI
jgi:hypothetical protein